MRISMLKMTTSSESSKSLRRKNTTKKKVSAESRRFLSRVLRNMLRPARFQEFWEDLESLLSPLPRELSATRKPENWASAAK